MNFSDRNFGILECAQNLAVSSRILQDLELLVLENTDNQNVEIPKL